MGKVRIDLSKLKDAQACELVLIKELQEAERHLAGALMVIDMTPADNLAKLSQRAVKARHKIQILKAQIRGVMENTLEFRVAIRSALERELLRAAAESRKAA